MLLYVQKSHAAALLNATGAAATRKQIRSYVDRYICSQRKGFYGANSENQEDEAQSVQYCKNI
jgi:hypothetical protein